MSILVEICKPVEVSDLRISSNGSPFQLEYPFADEDFAEHFIDLNQELVINKTATFYARVVGEASGSEFSVGDVLVVDRSLPLQNNKVAICYADGQFTVRKIRREGGALWLEALHTAFDAIRINEDNQFMIWGLVTYIVKRVW